MRLNSVASLASIALGFTIKLSLSILSLIPLSLIIFFFVSFLTMNFTLFPFLLNKPPYKIPIAPAPRIPIFKKNLQRK